MSTLRTAPNTVVKSSDGRLVVELRGRLNDSALAALRHQLDEASMHPGRPIILTEGARLRSVDDTGRVTPDGDVRIVLPWWALAWGAVIGMVATLLITGGPS